MQHPQIHLEKGKTSVRGRSSQGTGAACEQPGSVH